jgi:hypothetical protein
MQLTILAYDQLITLLEVSIKPGMNSPREIIEKYRHKISRLRQLIEALEAELLSQ